MNSIGAWLSDVTGAKSSKADLPTDSGLIEGDQEKAFLDNLDVEPVRNSRLVRIHYQSPNPTEASTIPNALANNFINMNLERRFEASSYAKRFLAEQLQQIRANLEDSEQRLATYARERQIVNVDDRLEILMGTLREIGSSLVKTEGERMAAEADYLEATNANNGGTPMVLDSQVIQGLKERLSNFEAEYQEKLNIYKPGYPKMQQLQNQINETKQAILQESSSITAGLRSAFDAKVRQEAKLNQRIAETKEELLALQDRSTDLQMLKREVDTNRALYDGLLQRMKEIGVAAGIGTNNVSVVDSAAVPLSPYKPSLAKNLAIALVLGLFLGLGLAFLLEMLDDSVKTSEEVERRVGAPMLGLFPMMSLEEAHHLEENQISLLVARDPKSALAEAARSLRTSLLFSTSEGAPRICHFTSSNAGEGKTTSAASAAITFAQAGSKVLIVECDLRNPSLHRLFGLPNTSGLTNYLAGDVEPAEISRPTQVTRLFTITSGPLPPNPVELLSSPKMVDLLTMASERFDYVVLDGPPVIGLADALVLANLATATVFIVQPGKTRIGALESSVRRLRSANANLLGSVLTKVGHAGRGYGYGYGYGV